MTSRSSAGEVGRRGGAAGKRKTAAPAQKEGERTIQDIVCSPSFFFSDFRISKFPNFQIRRQLSRVFPSGIFPERLPQPDRPNLFRFRPLPCRALSHHLQTGHILLY